MAGEQDDEPMPVLPPETTTATVIALVGVAAALIEGVLAASEDSRAPLLKALNEALTHQSIAGLASPVGKQMLEAFIRQVERYGK